MKDIDREGIAKSPSGASPRTAGTGGIHVSFDLDVCDPMHRARRRHAGQGRARLPRSAHGDGARRRLAALVALDLVEVNPTLDIRNTTAEFGTELALSALGKRIL
jgi:arginase